MPARLRQAAAARSCPSLFVLACFRARPGSVWSCKTKPRSGSRAPERRTVACWLFAARARRPRAGKFRETVMSGAEDAALIGTLVAL